MRCRKVRRQFETYLDGEQRAVPVAGRESVKAHLEGCEACRRELSQLRRLRERLAEVPAPPVPEGFAGRVVARAKARYGEESPLRRAASAHPRASAWYRLRLAAGTVAALAAGLALGAFLGNDVGRDAARQGPTAETRQADQLTGAGLGRFVVESDDSLAQAYLEITTGRDG